jgi:hypothetical protein
LLTKKRLTHAEIMQIKCRCFYKAPF